MSTSLVEKQLFSNNASSTLVSSVSAIDTVLSLAPGSGSAFPYLSTNQYFLATIDSEDFLEVVKCTSRLGDTLTVVRAQEGTTSYPFPSGTLVQVRVTKGTLEEFSKSTERLYDVLSVDSLPRAGDAAGNSFVCNSQDDYGNPIVAIKRDDLWSFASHTTSLVDGLASIGGSTSLSSTAVPLLPTAPYQGRYIVQFTSGPLRGICRLVIMTSGNVLTWAEPTPTAVTAGTTFTVYLSNAYQFSLVSTVPSKAPLASPALTGTPTAPTAANGTSTTQIASTAFVQAQLAGTFPAASETVAGKVELATAAETTAGTDNTRAVHPAGLKVELDKKAPLASPALTGTPTAPTASAGTNTTQVATTEYVIGQAATVVSPMNGVAAVGTSTKFARQDHVHTSDTTKAPLASPALTGTPTAPTAAAGTNTTQLASTAFVQAAVGVGNVSSFAMATPPTGWLKANGAAINRTTYAALFAAIGTTFGAGDDSTTFNVPDLRGVFARGWDDGREVDSARSFGSAQLDAMQGHLHQYGGVLAGSVGYNNQTNYANTNTEMPTGNPISDGTNGTPRTAAETRPRNVALLYCIKY